MAYASVSSLMQAGLELDRNVELGDRGGDHRRDVDLPLLLDPIRDHLAATGRAAARQPSVELAVGRPEGGGPMAVSSMRVAAPAAGPLGVRLRLALGERGRLTLAAPTLLLERPLQLGDPLRLDDQRPVFQGDLVVPGGQCRLQPGDRLLQATHLSGDIHTASMTTIARSVADPHARATPRPPTSTMRSPRQPLM